MALIPTQVLDVATGAAPTFAAAAAADTAECDPSNTLIVKNASGSPINVTVSTPGNLGTGDAYPDKVYSVPATNGERWIPLIDAFRDPALNGQAAIAYSATASVTRAVVRR
jgi:hypothetical protein